MFVNPHGGHRVAPRTWEAVRPVFDLAGVRLQVVTTERRHHAYQVMEGMSSEELDRLDGVVVVVSDPGSLDVLGHDRIKVMENCRDGGGEICFAPDLVFSLPSEMNLHCTTLRCAALQG